MSKHCPKCNRSMEQGFTVDTGDSGVSSVSDWHRGAPDRRWWGLKTRKTERLAITSWRCTGCGFIEHYAAGISSR